MYNPPEYVPAMKQKEIFDWVETVVSQFILTTNQDEYQIIRGDFNQRRKNFLALAQRYGLKQVLTEVTPTHNKGNHLDDLYTNLKFSSFTLVTGISDHSGIMVNLEISLKRNQKIPKQKENFT